MLGTEMFEWSPVAMSLSHLDSRKVVMVNPAFAEAFGISREAIVGKTPHEVGILFGDDIRERSFTHLAAGGTVQGLELETTTPLGIKWFALWSRLVDIAGERHVMSTYIDVTERHRAIEESKVLTEQFQQLAENVHEVFWLTDPGNTKMFWVSPAYEKIFGRPVAALYANPRDWLAAVHPDDRARMAALKDHPAVDTYRVTVGGKVRTIQISTFPVRDAAGNVIRIAGVGEDRTDQLELEAQLRQTQKLESLGLLAGGVAHDFNNVLAVIGANAGLLTELLPVGHPDRELVDEIEDAVRRATSLTRQLLAFSRKEVIEPVVLDVNAAIGDTRKMLRRMMGEDIVIETSLDPELGRAKIDPGYFVQLLMNTAVNARDAMPRGGKLTISTRNIGEHIVIEIADTGCGMPPEVLSRVFEPFFTTKNVGHGTGLGLSVVHGIVQQASGAVEIDSQVGVGTVIRIRLPSVSAPAENVGDVSLTGLEGTEKIVLVDDDLFVRRATSRALRSRGYTVLEAGDASAALRLLRDHGHDVALLVTDVVMPGVDGRELAQAAREHRPSLEVLYMSGYTDDAVIRHGLEHDRIPFIEKPFRTHALAGKVRHLIEESARRKNAG